MSSKDGMLKVDFNEMLESDLVLLSQDDIKLDSLGSQVLLYEGLAITIYMDDVDDLGRKDDLIAHGIVERNSHLGWSSAAKWCCRIDLMGIENESDP